MQYKKLNVNLSNLQSNMLKFAIKGFVKFLEITF